LEKELASLESATGTERAAVQAGVAGDADAAVARLASLRESLALLKAEGAAQAEAEGPLAAMQQDAEATRSSLQSLLAQIDQTAQQAAIQTPDARILSRAEAPVTPSSPKAGLLLAAALLAGAVIGGLIAWARETAGLTLRTESEVRKALRLPVVGAIPRLRGRRKAGAEVAVALAAETGRAAGQIDALRTRLRVALGDPRVLVLTSSRPGEGKSTLALALACRAARRGERVLLIDCDRARPNLSRFMGAETAPGLAELCAMTDVEAGRLLLQEDASGFAFLPCGDGTRRFGLDALPGLMARQGWRRDFDLILLDAPPALASADALTLSEYADGTLFCLRWRHTPRRLAIHARTLLKRSGEHGMAVVLTQLEPAARALRGFPEAEIAARPYAAYARR
jgi:Mrp family chromosome partitioning ATPase